MKNNNLRELFAIKCLLGAAFFYSLFSVFSRLMGEFFSPFFQAWSRAIPTLLILLIIGYFRKTFKKIDVKDRKWFLVVCISAALVNAPFYVAAINIPIGMTMFIFYAASTILSYFLGYTFFSEHLTKNKILSIIFALMGLTAIYLDKLRLSKLEFMFFAALAGALFSIYLVFSKKLSNKYSSEQINFLDYIFTLVIYFAISIFIKETFYIKLFSLGWLWNILYSFATVGAVILTVTGFKNIEAQKGSIILLTELIFVILFGFIFFKEVPTLNSIVGGLLIVISLAIPNLKVLKLAMLGEEN